MHFNNFILGLLFAATTWARGRYSFFTINDGKLERLSRTFTRNYDLLISNHHGFHDVQQFNFKDGVASIRSGKYEQVFGLVNGIYTIGYREHVEPVQLQLDANSRITNLQSEMCVCPYERYWRKDHRGPCIHDMKCSPKDIFFLTIDESRRLASELKAESRIEGRPNDKNGGIKKPIRMVSKEHAVRFDLNIFIQANKSRSSIGDCEEGSGMANIGYAP